MSSNERLRLSFAIIVIVLTLPQLNVCDTGIQHTSPVAKGDFDGPCKVST
jgi:hypothetical protein